MERDPCGRILIMTVLLCLLWGCSTPANYGGRSQEDALPFGWERIGRAAKNAALARETWVPVVGALALQIGDADKKLQSWAAQQTPVFGSQRNADRMSDGLKLTSSNLWVASALAPTPGTGKTLLAKAPCIVFIDELDALGYTQQTPTEDRYLLRKSELLDRLDVLLGGRVAEQLVFDDVSTGAENDLQCTTDMARHMVTHYDMSEALGLATYDTRPAALYLDGPARPEQCNCSERTAEVIDSEVRRLLDEAHERVSITLTAHRATLEALAAELLEKEVVDRKMLDDLLRATLPAPPAAAVPGTAANTNTNASEVTP